MTTTTKITLISLTSTISLLTSCSKTPPQIRQKAPNPAISASKALPDSAPSLLNTKELEVILRNKETNTPAARKAERLFNTPFVSNSHYRKYGIPKRSTHPLLGESLRLSTWNIEKSKHIREAASALKSEKSFIADLKPEILKNKTRYTNALRQRQELATSDILLLQEMDIGHCRSGYTFAAKEMANALGMNYAYAPQQLEIDPVYLGTDDVKFKNPHISDQPCGTLVGNAAKYKGVFGVAVLSRYPIKRVQIFPLKTQPHDWYYGEIEDPDFLEKGRRLGAKALFNADAGRELKVGGRGFTRVDLHVPGVENDTISIINIHLEIKASPDQRTAQMTEVLSYINGIKNPVIMAGDHNSSSTDVSPTSVSRATKKNLTDPSRLTSIALFLGNATGISQARNAINGFKNFQNPLAWGIPVILPNKTKPLFKAVKSYRFDDGGAFDFRGDKIRSIGGHSQLLSNANQRTSFKGFTQTFTTPQHIGPFGCERLDWIFVKSHLKDSTNDKGSYKLAPHFGETLSLMNQTVTQPFSDHHPITVLLPFNEPNVDVLKAAYAAKK